MTAATSAIGIDFVTDPTVAAVNAYGTSTASPASNAVTPYTVPGPPTITAATAGDSAAFAFSLLFSLLAVFLDGRVTLP